MSPVPAEWEEPRVGRGPVEDGFTDAVTFSFGDLGAEVFGLARVGLSAGPAASGLAVLFSGREPVAARAAGGLVVSSPQWGAVDAAGVTTDVVEPLRAWDVAFADEDGVHGFALRFTAVGEPALVEDGSALARTGGMAGYDQLCRVTGRVKVPGGERTVDCLGQRSRSWGTPDWDKLALTRTIGVWVDEAHGMTLSSVRSVKAKGHGDEAVAAAVWQPVADEVAPDGGLAVAVGQEDPRFSTVLDADGRQRRAGLELYEDEESYPRRAAGDVVCGTSLDLGRLRLDCSFFVWTVDGRPGVGRYDVLRRA